MSAANWPPFAPEHIRLSPSEFGRSRRLPWAQTVTGPPVVGTGLCKCDYGEECLSHVASVVYGSSHRRRPLWPPPVRLFLCSLGRQLALDDAYRRTTFRYLRRCNSLDRVLIKYDWLCRITARDRGDSLFLRMVKREQRHYSSVIVLGTLG
jgi:hypothetical protein